MAKFSDVFGVSHVDQNSQFQNLLVENMELKELLKKISTNQAINEVTNANVVSTKQNTKEKKKRTILSKEEKKPTLENSKLPKKAPVKKVSKRGKLPSITLTKKIKPPRTFADCSQSLARFHVIRLNQMVLILQKMVQELSPKVITHGKIKTILRNVISTRRHYINAFKVKNQANGIQEQDI